MNHRIIALGALAALVVAPLTACSASGGNGSSQSGGKTTINMSFWSGGQADQKVWEHVAGLVHAKYPDITVNLQTASWNDYWTKLPTSIQGSDAPCVVGMQMARVQQFGSLLTPITPYESKVGIQTSDFNSSILKALQVNGQQVAIPYDFGPYFVYYNKDSFKAAGLSEPQSGWTTDDFVADAKKLTSGSKYGFALNNAIDAMSQWAPTIAGVQPATESGKLDLTSAGMQKTLAWYAGLHTTEKVAPALASDSSTTDSSQFLAGNSAMYVSGPWDMVNVKQSAKFDVGTVTMPVGAAGAATAVGGSGFGITQKCSEKDAAAKVISVATGAKALAYLGSTGRAYPARPAEATSWYSSAVSGAQSTLDAALKVGQPYRSTPNWTQVGISWTNGVVSVINGQASADSFLKSVQSSSGS